MEILAVCGYFKIRLSACRSPAQRGWKGPIWSGDTAMETVFGFLDSAAEYFGCLATSSGQLLRFSSRKTWAVGYMSNISALKSLTRQLFTDQSMKFILTYRLCQDPVEHFFGEIRQKGGFNNNPNAAQFQ